MRDASKDSLYSANSIVFPNRKVTLTTMKNEIPTVFVVDDDPSARKGLERLISASDFPVDAFASAREFLELVDAEDPGCIILDVQMPEMTGPELHDELRASNYYQPVIFLSAHADVPTTAREMKKGAVHFLTKPVDANELFEAIRESLALDENNREIRYETADAIEKVASLSPREREVMTYVIAGMLNKQIADELNIALGTVKIHRGRVMEKLGVVSIVQLMDICKKAGVDAAEVDII